MYRVLRSLLFVPGNRQRLLEKAPTLDADAVVFDLEDSVPLEEKGEARRLIRGALEGLRGEFPQPYVRVNSVEELMEQDLRETVVPALRGVCFPKAESAEQIRRLDLRLGELEREMGLEQGAFKIIAIIETALGVVRVYDIASASERVEAVSFGAEDFTLDLGTSRTKEGIELLYSRGRIAVAAAAARVRALDTVFTDIQDEEGLVRESQLVKQLGFHGKYVIHPAQIGPVNRVFSPSEEEVAYARRVVEAFNAAQAEGTGVVKLDGKMIDLPVVEKARRVLSVAETISRRGMS